MPVISGITHAGVELTGAGGDCATSARNVITGRYYDLPNGHMAYRPIGNYRAEPFREPRLTEVL